MPKRGPSTIEDRLHRVEGQIRGIEDMVKSGEDVKKVIAQIKAAISSLESVKIRLVKEQVQKNIVRQFDDLSDLL